MRVEYTVKMPEEPIYSVSFFSYVYSPVKSKVRVRVFVGNNCEYELIPDFVSGSGDEIVIPFSGYICFVMPQSVIGLREMKYTLIFDIIELTQYVDCTVYALLAHGRKQGCYDLPIEPKRCIDNASLDKVQNSFSFQNLSVHDVVPLCGVRDSKGEATLFDLRSIPKDSYLMVHSKESGNAPNEKVKCNLFLPKNHFSPTEPMIVSYSNVYAKLSLQLYTVSMHCYASGAKPGIDFTKDYATIMFKRYNRGKSGAIVFPEEGVRNYVVREPGNYTLHIHQAYRDLCPPLSFSVDEKAETDEINAPPSGTLYFIQRAGLSEQIRIKTKHASDLTVWAFRCEHANMDSIEQRLYQMDDLDRSIGDLRRYNLSLLSLQTSLLRQALHTACTQEMIKLSRQVGSEVEDTLWQDIILYIEENLCNNINIQMLEEHFHRSKSFFSHYFKKHIGISFASFVYQSKMARAKQLLMGQEQTISQIAAALSYSDVQTFSHAFRKMEGMSPQEFRQQHKNIGHYMRNDM